jgi:hypothetical protein
MLPKLRSGTDLKVGMDVSVTFDNAAAAHMEAELRQILDDLGVSGDVEILSPEDAGVT